MRQGRSSAWRRAGWSGGARRGIDGKPPRAPLPRVAGDRLPQNESAGAALQLRSLGGGGSEAVVVARPGRPLVLAAGRRTDRKPVCVPRGVRLAGVRAVLGRRPGGWLRESRRLR